MVWIGMIGGMNGMEGEEERWDNHSGGVLDIRDYLTPRDKPNIVLWSVHHNNIFRVTCQQS